MNTDNNCRNRREALAALVLGELPPASADELKIHIETCQTCRRLYQTLAEEEQNIRSAFEATAKRSQTVQTDLVRRRSNKVCQPQPRTVKLVLKTILGSKITKLVAAAAVVVLVLFFARSTERNAWAAISEAFEKVECVHMVEWEIKPDGEKIKDDEYWIKRPNLFRNDNPTWLRIDNGVEELEINKGAKTAQLSESEQQPQAKSVFSFVAILREPDPNFENQVPILSKVPAECNDVLLVYDAHYEPRPDVHRTPMKFKMWVDAKALLIRRMVAPVGDENPGLELTVEYVLDYENIPNKMFALDIPDGYELLPPPKLTIFSGTVLDQNDKPVSGAEVHILGDGLAHLSATTDANGAFLAKKRTEFGARFGFPILVRAFRRDVPDEVAWTIIQDPEDKKELPDNVPNCGNTEVFVDPNAPGTWKCTGARGVVIKMQPALQIAGKVTDEVGTGLPGAAVPLHLKYKDGTYFTGGAIWFNASNSVADSQGRYLLGNLPMFPEGFSVNLEAAADGYISASRSLKLDGTPLQKGIDFSLLKGGVTIKGVVKNAAGEPLPCYAIWHTVNGKRIGSVQCLIEAEGEFGSDGDYGFTNKNGKFELANCPAMKGLAVTASGAGKSPHWNFRMKHWKMDRRFAYYDEKTIDVGFQPGKNEYYVEIVLKEAATTMEFEVKDPEGNPVEGTEVAIGTSPFDYGDEFKTTTDNTGRCVLRNLPWIKQPRLSVRKSDQPKYVPLIWRTLDLPENVYNYKVEVTLKYGDGRIPVEKEVTVHALPN